MAGTHLLHLLLKCYLRLWELRSFEKHINWANLHPKLIFLLHILPRFFTMDNKAIDQQQEYADVKTHQHYEKGRRFSGYDPEGRRASVVDDVFGEIKEGGPNYRNVRCAL